MSSHDPTPHQPANTHAVLLLAHGTVSSNAELPAFLSKIRRGRPPPPGLIEELEKRYDAIGGSPHLALTRQQAEALSAKMGCECFVAMRLWKPSVAEVLPQIAERGIRRVCLLPLAPFSVEVYDQAARAEAQELGSPLELLSVDSWGRDPAFVRAQARWIESYTAQRIAEHRPLPNETAIVLTAHSLPMRAIAAGDTYGPEAQACAEAIGAELGRPVKLAYQSQGADAGDWLGPDLKQTLEELSHEGVRHVVLAPFGFLSDHVETLYDLDIEAKAWAEQLELGFTRVPALNTNPAFITALAGIAERALKLDPE